MCNWYLPVVTTLSFSNDGVPLLMYAIATVYVESWLDERGHSLVPLSNPGSNPEV